MTLVCAVSFERYGKLYYLDPGPHRPAVGDLVLVPTDEGPEVAECVWAPQEVYEPIGGLPVLAGLAAEADGERRDSSPRRRAGGPGGDEAAGAVARPADEGRRCRPHRAARSSGAGALHRLLHCAGTSGLPP